MIGLHPRSNLVKDVMKKQNELPLCQEGDMIMDQFTEVTSKVVIACLWIMKSTILLGPLLMVHAKSTWRDVQKSGFTVDSVALTTVLFAASNTEELHMGKTSHGYLIRHGIEDEDLESYLIDMYAKFSCIKISQRVLDDYGNVKKR